ncbi:MAG TPA: YihY/virulence factor BrkB family protein [Blastocatellia bacterium]|nr:YihY/virulence factor BrkB family protein [Blastocatellia bacterium]
MPGKAHRHKILTRSFMSFMDNDLTTAAAAVSYFSMLALFPTLLLLLSIGSRLLGAETVQKYVIGQVLTFLPGASAFVSKNLESFSEFSNGIILSCVLVMLWAASWMFTVIEKALNRIWGTFPRSFLHGRAVNIAVMSLVFFLLAASALFTAFVTGVRAAANRIPLKLAPWLAALSGYAWQTIFVIASLVVTVILFAVLYKLLPNAKVSVLEALPGAVLAGVFWEAAKFGFAFLLPYFHYDLLYGSIGAAVALLTWVYMSSVIMLFGAQFTALLHRDHLFNAASVRPDHATGEVPVVEAKERTT